MRTIDPELWQTKIKSTNIITKRKLFGSQSVTAFENRLRSSFMDALKDFWDNCSIKCIKHMSEKNLPPPIRRCYIIFVVVFTLCGMAVIGSNWREYRSKPPLMINRHSMQHPVQYVDFPAVAVCSYSVISRKALKEYARYLYSLDHNATYTLDTIERNLLTFGALLTWTRPPVDVAFTQYLARVAHETNVTNVILKLTPQCSSFLKRCGWRTARVPCDRLFALRATPRGLCCVFNSRYQPEDLYNPVQKLNFIGDDSGLSLVVKEDDSDVAYIRGPGEGVEILLFDGSEYPLIEGGPAKVYLTQRNASAFFKLSVRAQYSAPGLQYFKEMEKLMYFYPGDFADPGLNEESSDSLNCEHCLPDCTRLSYSAAVSQAVYKFTEKFFLNNFVNGVTLTNTTVIRIFYGSEDQQLYIIEANMRWFEVLAALGSRWMCVFAVTSVGVTELLYHVTVRCGYHYMRRRRIDLRHKKKRAI